MADRAHNLLLFQVSGNDLIDYSWRHEENSMQVGMHLAKIHWKSAPEFHPILVPMTKKLGGPSGAISAPIK